MSDKLKALNYAMQEPATLPQTRTGTVVQCVAGFENEAAVLADQRRPGRGRRAVPVDAARRARPTPTAS